MGPGAGKLSTLFRWAFRCVADGDGLRRRPLKFIWMNVKGPIDAGTTVGLKTGKACATSYLGFVALGDASISAAAKAGGITNIQTVDHHTLHKIFVGEFCTIVHGS
jgi:hypothetical protein